MPQKKTSENFESLYRHHYAFLALVSFQIIKDRGISKDIVQDFFLSFWLKKDTTIINKSFQAYAFKAVRNLSFQYLEKLKKDTAISQNLHVLKYEDPILREEAISDRNMKIKELLNQLPEARRNIFISYVVQGLSYSEIARKNNISINTVKTQMKRAYAFFRAKAANGIAIIELLLVIFKIFP